MIKRVIAIISRGEARNYLMAKRQADEERKYDLTKGSMQMYLDKITELTTDDLERLDPDALVELIDLMRNYIDKLYKNEDKLQEKINELNKEIRRIQDERFLYMRKFSVHY